MNGVELILRDWEPLRVWCICMYECVCASVCVSGPEEVWPKLSEVLQEKGEITGISFPKKGRCRSNPSHLHIEPTPYSPTVPSSCRSMNLPPFSLAVQCKHFFRVRCQICGLLWSRRMRANITVQCSHPFPLFVIESIACHLKTDSADSLCFCRDRGWIQLPRSLDNCRTVPDSITVIVVQ